MPNETTEPLSLQPVTAAAKSIGINVKLIRRAIRRGELAGFRLGVAHGLHVDRKDVLRWVEARRVTAP